MNTPNKNPSPYEQEILGRLKAHSVFLAKLLKLLLLPQPSCGDSTKRRLKIYLDSVACAPERYVLGLDAPFYREFFVCEIKTFSAILGESPDPGNT